MLPARIAEVPSIGERAMASSVRITYKKEAKLFFASVDKGIRGFSRGKTTHGCVILVGERQPTCLVCLASRRLSAAKNSEGLAGTAGVLPARQRTQACWRKSRTITPQAAFQPRPQACVPLSTDACYTELSFVSRFTRFRTSSRSSEEIL